MHDLDAAEIHVDRAFALDGGCARAWRSSGYIKVYRGRPEEAIECFQISNSLDPTGTLRPFNFCGFASANFEAGRYREAAHWWKRGLMESPAEWWPNKFLTPTFALLSRKDEALASLHTLRRAVPEWVYNRASPMLPNTEAFNDQLANGWENIGVRISR
jgi:tetratricopeptide (TPR) repeat protein